MTLVALAKAIRSAHSELRDTVLEDGIKVKASFLEGAIMRNGSNIGP